MDDRKQYKQLYNCWVNMKQRCYNKNHPEYFRYGARGIEVDSSWLDFNKFKEDMGFPEDNLSLDRKDSNKNYSKDNCRWATNNIQSFNRGSINTNKSGCKGVYKEKQTGKWKAFIGYNNKQISLGRFSNIDEAILARRSAELLYYGKQYENM